MKTKYRIKSTIQFFAFAFYPKTTLIVPQLFQLLQLRYSVGLCLYPKRTHLYITSHLH